MVLIQGPSLLAQVVARTRERVTERRRIFPIDKLQVTAPTPTGRRPFAQALTRPGRFNVIAEFKRRSPSKGSLRADLHPVQVAQAYEIAGAAALSVLTEEEFFGGSLEDLREARGATLLPTLRKDFIVDPYQIWEAWYAGADAILLIVAALSDAELSELHATAVEVGLDAVVEVHDRVELDRGMAAGARIVGVNSRDLRTLQVDLDTAFSLASLVPAGVIKIAESGIKTGADLRRLREAGYHAFLVGEHLMTSPDPGLALESLIKSAAVASPNSQPRVAVKICGITSVEDGLAAVRAGADAVGFVFWPSSPRVVDAATARRISQSLPPFVSRVGVFVDASREQMASVADEVGLDLVQLHGSESPAQVAAAPRRGIKALRVGQDFDSTQAARFEEQASAILVDAESGIAPGGTGQRFDWSRARALRSQVSHLILAGGLDAENVAEAIATVRPDGVDVSSGVESSPGKKDAAKMRAFVEAVRKAEA
ncbi:MAG TPA: bifunctional indole-3-glycerol-phosphate synthase TrpC/phosphoribosylanthranilate isomerase TrpF [Vicinamibacteria bacterium]|nr:bifunctional indole-3-glycerol-phosphate synthase TrpC/phosphoribosylanthranilate isomerase TrpF [Vicinamibacteria bacterium]